MIQSKPRVASVQTAMKNPMKQRILNEMAITLNFLDGFFICGRTFVVCNISQLDYCGNVFTSTAGATPAAGRVKLWFTGT